MQYSPEQFQNIIAEVEDQGGAATADLCLAQDVQFAAPPYNKTHTERRVTCGCGHPAIFVSVYDPGPDTTNNAGYVRSCAVCDNMGAWPRYQEAMA